MLHIEYSPSGFLSLYYIEFFHLNQDQMINIFKRFKINQINEIKSTSNVALFDMKSILRTMTDEHTRKLSENSV